MILKSGRAGLSAAAILSVLAITIAFNPTPRQTLNAAATIAEAIQSQAEAHQHPIYNTPVNVTITSAEYQGHGADLPLYWIHTNKRNTHKAYLEATLNRHYAINITNNTSARIGLVIAVDGRNIITGDYSTLSPHEAMYVLNGLETAAYRGWRTSKDQINTFYFTDAPDSYAAAFGDKSAMGVIAVAAYQEKKPIPLVRPELKYDRGVAPQESAKPAPSQQPGTGFGDPEESPSIKVNFDPNPNTLVKYLIKYEWRETLCSKAIIDCTAPTNRLWDEDRYAPYPPNKRR